MTGARRTAHRSSNPTAGVVRIKRAYAARARSDGKRILVDRLWPRGLSKEKAAIDQWLKEIAPSTALRRWFGHDPDRWPEFQRRYKRELHARRELVSDIAKLASRGPVTLVFGARDETHNDAVVLAAVVCARMRRSTTTTRGNARHR